MSIAERIPTLFPCPDEIPPQQRLSAPVELRDYLLNGELRHWQGAVQDVFSPVCVRTPGGPERVRIGSFPLMGEADALAALDAATAAYDCGRGRWPTMGVADRIRHVQHFASLMKEQREAVVRLIMWEIGKTRADAEKEFDRTVVYITDTIDALKELDRVSSRFVIEQGIIGQIRRGPLGVALCMGPYNYPLNETFTTLIPALIMGNTVVMKPPRHGVLLFAPLLAALREAFPPGVVNVLLGAGRALTPTLMRSGRIDVLAFIGTSKAANTLLKDHPRPNRLRLVLGLEAKNPAIVLPDADLNLAVEECLAGSLAFNGQRCTALKLLFVHESVAQQFIAIFSRALSAIGTGMPWQPGVMITPLPEEGKTAYLQELLADAVARGAAVVNDGGGTVTATYFHPALVYPVAPGMRLYTEEQFGPVVPVVPFTDVEEPIRAIRESDYGQQVSIFGRNSTMLAPLIDHLVNQVSRVNINSQCQRGPDVFPFTGRKDSAVGTLSVSDALRAFSLRTLVAARNHEINKEIITDIVRERRSTFLSTDFIL
ncbi:MULTISPECIES: NADP-dependent glyceraldehyde-3-phosphate dehydrogenase [Geobacter]|uniref:NADP-dependent glyceraldehyde-3-phosphate dehydrogenase n=1 Tax=Geobacter TaxID=28231 RepID=UPI002572C216|nr:NADP-dependent glyceraldehyde-3-phosphate dehydrogenase [Geobacter sulfurreducens]BEH11180.1 NADP-dependent glyceraldehyde-3-phosphate dehydrogenase [Geobacter sulfurreducens subsp. ethanolicus]BET59029.1 NADP-dependent glyceraldehyde-3-phosphate dehydrogenase [Geobacter sp. 60473]